jgi:hypothetical protein
VNAVQRRLAARRYSRSRPPSRSLADTVEVDDIGEWLLVARRKLAEGRQLPERAVWPVLVVGR